MSGAILHLADLHLGASVDARLEESAARQLAQTRQGVLRSLARWVAETPSLGLVLIAGDLFDEFDPPAALVADVRAALSEIAGRVPVITVPGNHDEFSYARCVYRQGNWPGILVENPHPEVVWRGQIAGRRCALVSAAYQAGKVPPGHRLKLVPREEVFGKGDSDGLLIGLFHGTLADHFPSDFVASERCFWLSHQEAASLGYDYLALGHFHSHRTWLLGRCVAHYPGPPLGPRASDPGSGSFSLVRTASDGLKVMTVESGPILGCAWRSAEISVQPQETPQGLADRISTQLQRSAAQEGVTVFWAVRLSGTTLHAELISQVEDALRQAGLVCVVTEGDLRRAAPPDLDALAAEESLVGYFVREWQNWRQTADPPEDIATAALYEGLTALGWTRGGRGNPS